MPGTRRCIAAGVSVLTAAGGTSHDRKCEPSGGGVGSSLLPLTLNWEWYVGVLGRPADMFPHEGEAVRGLAPTASIFVVRDRERIARRRALTHLDAMMLLCQSSGQL